MMTGGMHQKPVNDEQLDQIVERLYSTHTKSGGRPCKATLPVLRNTIACAPVSVDAQIDICKRLYSTPTKASSGAKRCKSAGPRSTPGLGLKCMPIIEGLEERFKGKKRAASGKDGTPAAERLHRAQTAAGRSRQDYPKVLLWPERTLVGGNLERVKAFHDTGIVSKQSLLARRDKWFL